LERHPDVVLASVYAVPDTVVGDQVMAALQLTPGARFDPATFTTFLSQQSDLGTKWAPRYIRLCDSLPTTATSKVLTRTLRAERWNTSDPVWWRPENPDGPDVYQRLEPTDVDALETAISTRR
jgi:fatty-acyl-CoA synthase